MSSDASFPDLMARLQAGDEQAAVLIFRRFSQQLIALARKNLDDRLRQKEDPEDVMQSVFRSFFRRQAAGDFVMENWNSLWGLLTVITLRKCGHRVEHFLAACRDVRREAAPRTDVEHASWEALGREPGPTEAAMLNEAVEQLLRDLEPCDRRILELSLQGHTVAEVSVQVGRVERTVQRLLARVRQRLERAADDEPPTP